MKKFTLNIIIAILFVPFSLFAQYPSASGTNATYEYVKNVSFSDINLTSGGLPYSDHTTETVGGLVQGSTYTLNVTAHVTSGSWREYVRVWIDWNHDYDFNDAGELVLQANRRFSGDYVFSASITVPATAVNGTTRMRVAQEYGQYPNNTGTFYWGEVEDYKLAIGVPAVMTSPVTSISIPNAVGGGNVVNQDAGPITERGICWSTVINPTIADNVVVNAQATTGSWTDLMTGLVSGQTYYVRAYAKNAQGISYGQNVTFTGAIVHYVSKTGSDATGDGSSGNPWATITHAISMSNAGDKIILLNDIIDNSIVIDKNITIEGLGAQTSKIMAASTAGSASARVMTVNSGVTATIRYLTIQNGNVAGRGGGIYVQGDLTIEECSIDNNNATGTNDGGAIYVISGASCTISRSALFNNSSRYGGAVFAEDNAIVNISNSTVSNNSASYGGGFLNGTGELNITNCTIVNNSATNQGGGIYSNSNPSLIYLKNTIVALNSAGSGPDIQNTVNSSDYNLIQNTSGATINGTTANNIYSTNPSLAAMALNGAQTMNYAPQAGSPVINSGTDNGAEQTDQRGKYRLGTTDIGAHEYQGTDTYIWDGAGGTGSWFNTALWSGNFLPDNTTSATVRNGVCNVDNTSASVRNLMIETTATLNINSGFILQATGNVYSYSSSNTGQGELELNGANSVVQNLKGKFGNVNLNNIYGLEVVDTVNVDNLLRLQTGNVSIGTGFLGINDVLTEENGRLIGNTSSKLSFGDVGSAALDTIPGNLDISLLEINRVAGMLLKGDFTIEDSLKLTNGTFNIDTNSVTINGVLKSVSGNLSGSNKAVITVGGTGNTLSLPSVTLRKLDINRPNGVSLSGNLSIVDTLNLNNGDLDLNAANLTLDGIITGTGFLIGNGASDFTIQGSSGNFTFNFKSGTETLNNLLINRAGSKITLNSALTLNGSLNVSAGQLVLAPTASCTALGNTTLTGTLYLQSDASNTASFIDNGTITGTGYFERYMKGDDFHYISAPFSQVDTSIFTLDGTYQNRNFYSYDETKQSTWNGGNHDDITGWTSPAVVASGGFLEVTRGYAFAYSSDKAFLLQGGNFNTGNYSSIPISYTDYADITSTYEGWNLVGNPYPSRLDANAFISANSSLIEATLYFWDEPASNVYTSGDYATWNALGSTAGGGGRTPNGYIEVGQAFFVKAKAGAAGNLTFNNNMRTHSTSAAFFKTGEISYPRLKLAIISPENNYNELLIGEMPDADINKDKYDAYKNEGNSSLSFYSKIGADNFAIQGVPLLQDSLIVPLGYHAGVAGNYTISVSRFENFDNHTIVYLFDSLENKYIELNNNVSYTFNTEVGRFDNRFKVVFRKFKENITYWTTTDEAIWNDSLNWSNGIPDRYTKAIINNGKVLLKSDSAVCFSLILGENTTFIIDSAANLSVLDSLIAYSGKENSAQLQIKGELTYNSLAWKKAVLQNSLVAVPFKSKPISITNVDEFNYFKRGKWEQDFSLVFDSIQEHFGNLSVLSGFDTVTFSGTILNNSFTEFLNDTGIYLLGNPFTHTIDLSNSSATNLSAVTNSIYRDNGIYNMHYKVAINGATSILNPFETFWMKAGDSATVEFYDNMDTAAAIAVNYANLKIQLYSAESKDESLIISDSNNPDKEYSSEKLDFSSAKVVLYELADSMKYGIDAMDLLPGIKIPLGYSAASKQQLNLSTELSGLDYSVVLVDNQLNDSILMDSGVVYTFTTEAGTFDNRFELLIKEKQHQTGITDYPDDVKVWSYSNKNLVVQLPHTSEGWITIYNIEGKKVYRQRILSNRSNIKTYLPSGIYNVRVSYTGKEFYKKVIIRE